MDRSLACRRANTITTGFILFLCYFSLNSKIEILNLQGKEPKTSEQ